MKKTNSSSHLEQASQSVKLNWVTDPATSKRMRVIGRKNTKAEVLLRCALFALGLRYRLHDRALPGSPDIVFSKFRAVVFVNGCFWHRHDGCRSATIPKRNIELWQIKFDSNVARDKRVKALLIEAGWRVITLWECEILQDPSAVAQRVKNQLQT